MYIACCIATHTRAFKFLSLSFHCNLCHSTSCLFFFLFTVHAASTPLDLCWDCVKRVITRRKKEEKKKHLTFWEKETPLTFSGLLVCAPGIFQAAAARPVAKLTHMQVTHTHTLVAFVSFVHLIAYFWDRRVFFKPTAALFSAMQMQKSCIQGHKSQAGRFFYSIKLLIHWQLTSCFINWPLAQLFLTGQPVRLMPRALLIK